MNDITKGVAAISQGAAWVTVDTLGCITADKINDIPGCQRPRPIRIQQGFLGGGQADGIKNNARGAIVGKDIAKVPGGHRIAGCPPVRRYWESHSAGCQVDRQGRYSPHQLAEL